MEICQFQFKFEMILLRTHSALVFFILILELVVGAEINDEECDEQLFALFEAIGSKQFWAFRRKSK